MTIQIVRKGIVAMLETEDNLEVIAECSDGQEAVREYAQQKPDVILMDLVMPGMNGIDAIKEIKNIDSAARILVLTSFTSNEQVFAAIEAGANRIFIKRFGSGESCEIN